MQPVGLLATLSGDAAEETVLAQSHPATETFSYDANGNLSQDARWKYSYDYENRLVKMETRPSVEVGSGVPQERLEFDYDYLGRRFAKRYYRFEASSWQLQYRATFAYKGMSLIRETRQDAQNTVIADRSYLQIPSGLAYGDPTQGLSARSVGSVSA